MLYFNFTNFDLCFPVLLSLVHCLSCSSCIPVSSFSIHLHLIYPTYSLVTFTLCLFPSFTLVYVVCSSVHSSVHRSFVCPSTRQLLQSPFPSTTPLQLPLCPFLSCNDHRSCTMSCLDSLFLPKMAPKSMAPSLVLDRPKDIHHTLHPFW